MEFRKLMDSPIGPLTLEGDGENVTALRFGDCGGDRPSCPALEGAARELEEYFSGVRREFTVSLKAEGTDFQRAVWSVLRTIPYGETAAYGEVAAKVGNPRASRAVGGANNRNPLPILVPCHRVVGKDGSLTGYAGGLAIKEFLLKLERGSNGYSQTT